MSAGCIGSPCAFGCTPNGANGFICGCPTGYQRIGQVRHRCYAGILRRYFYLFSFDFQWSGSLFVHDQSTIARTLWRRHQQCTDVRDKSRSVSYTACGWQDNIDGRLLFLQGDLTIIPDHRVVRCWSQQRKKKLFSVPKVNGKGRHRRYLRTKSMDQELIARRHEIMKRRFVRSAKRHHHGEEYILKISLRQTRHRMRIIKLQPAVKVHFLVY